MKALYVVSHAVPSGPINQALNILMGMKLNNSVSDCLVTINSNNRKDNWINRFYEKGIRVIQLDIKSRFCLFKAARLLRRIIISEKIDIVHCSGFRVSIICMLASKGHCSVVSTIRSEPDAVSELFPVVFRTLIRKIWIYTIERIPIRVACSKAMQRSYSQDYNINMECVQNGVDTDYFIPLTGENKSALRKKIGIKDVRTFLVLGLLLPRKNNALIIDAFKSIDNSVGQLLIVGGGAEEALLKKKAQNNPNIVFIGQTNNPLEYIQASDILISASLSEGLPNTVLEGLSCGLIPILSDIEPHRELVEESKISHLFIRNSVESLTTLLKETSKWDCVEQSRCARELALSRYGVRALAYHYEKIYEKHLR